MDAAITAFVPSVLASELDAYCSQAVVEEYTSTALSTSLRESNNMNLSDFDGKNYGYVEVEFDYTDSTDDAISEMYSQFGTFSVSGGGATITSSTSDAIQANVGNQSGYIDRDNSISLGFNGLDVKDVQGNITITTDGNDREGFVSDDGSLMVLGESYDPIVDVNGYATAVPDTLVRGYAVELGSGVTSADLDGKTFKLEGLVSTASISGLSHSNYEGLFITFGLDVNNDLIATLTGLRFVQNFDADFDDENGNMPTLDTSPVNLGATDDIITKGYVLNGYTIDGFYTDNGLLLRISQDNDDEDDTNSGDPTSVTQGVVFGFEESSVLSSSTGPVSDSFVVGGDGKFQITFDTDDDWDGYSDESDNCPNTYNPDQLDSDGNGTGNACEAADPSAYTINESQAIIDACPSSILSAVTLAGGIDDTWDGPVDAYDANDLLIHPVCMFGVGNSSYYEAVNENITIDGGSLQIVPSPVTDEFILGFWALNGANELVLLIPIVNTAE